MPKKLAYLLVLVISSSFLVLNVSAQRGCCSWHWWVGYFDSNVWEYVCNDGTYSPTCGCYKKTVVTPKIKKTTPKKTIVPKKIIKSKNK